MARSISRREFVAGTAGTAALAGISIAALTHCVQTPKTELLTSLDLHSDTIDILGMTTHKPYSTFNDRPTGTLASSNTQVSAERMGDTRWAQCYAIWIPDSEGEEAGDIPALQWYHEAVAWFQGQMELCGDSIAQARSFADISTILEGGKVAAILTVENAACLDAGIEVVDEFVRDGVLIAGFTWNFKNALGSGNEYPDVGLTDLGKHYLAALEEQRIIADVSHLNEKGFWDVEKIATRPYIATHSNARAICNVPRNLTDEQFAAISARGGLVGLNFHQSFVHDSDSIYTFDELAAHVEHWLDLGGQDLIALGSDRDGANIPTWLADCSSQSFLFERFSERFGEQIARKLFFENAINFLTKWGR